MLAAGDSEAEVAEPTEFPGVMIGTVVVEEVCEARGLRNVNQAALPLRSHRRHDTAARGRTNALDLGLGLFELRVDPVDTALLRRRRVAVLGFGPADNG